MSQLPSEMLLIQEKPLTIEKRVSVEGSISNMQLLGPFAEIKRMREQIAEKNNYYKMKRIIDVVVSSFVVVFFMSWLFPLLAILIKAESRGPVLFRQRRVGKDGKTFRVLKFRSMVVNQEANSLQAQRNDIRITRIGKFLRLSNLDELPQFINVLRGEMSIVGPRPHMHADCIKFGEVVGNYQFRHLVKPGITGLAQVKGFRGNTVNFSSIFHRYQYDAFYVRNANFWLDLRIIRQTAVQTLKALIQKSPFPKVEVAAPQGRPKWVLVLRSLIN